MRIMFWAGFLAFITDQLSKYLVVHMMELSRIMSIDVLPPLLNFRYGENRGINFGLFGDGSDASRWILIAIAAVICVGVVIWARRHAIGVWAKISAGILVGGALANVVDRLVNMADVYIFAGAIGLIFFTSTPKPAPKTPRKKGQ